MTLATLFESHLSMLTAVQAWLAENNNFRVYRIGVLTHLFCHTRASANEKIARYFLQPRVLHGETPHELQLSMLSRPTLADSGMVNRWLRVRPLRSADARRVDFAAQIELDYNTLPEDTRVRTTRDVARFMEAVQANIEEDVPLLDDADFLA